MGRIFIRCILEVSEWMLTLVLLELIEELQWQTKGREKVRETTEEGK